MGSDGDEWQAHNMINPIYLPGYDNMARHPVRRPALASNGWFHNKNDMLHDSVPLASRGHLYMGQLLLPTLPEAGYHD